MGKTARAVILSDIHLGPGNVLSTFRDDRALAALLDTLTRNAAPTELVLAGDCFDFLQVEGYDGFDAAKAAQRFKEILDGPRTATVMAALKKFAARPDHEITLLSGNHDPELVLPEVRRLFESTIELAGILAEGLCGEPTAAQERLLAQLDACLRGEHASEEQQQRKHGPEGAIELPLPPQPIPSALLSRRAPFPAGERPFPRASALSRGEVYLPLGKPAYPAEKLLARRQALSDDFVDGTGLTASALSHRRAPFPTAERPFPPPSTLRRFFCA